MLGGTLDYTMQHSWDGGLIAVGYQLGAPLGSGASGWVFEAQRSGRPCAIKIGRWGWQEWLARESGILQQLGGVAAPRWMELGTAGDGRAFLAMELIEGCSLRRPTPLGGALLRAVGAAVDAVHAHAIVHRDLKPEHILVGSHRGAPWVRVLDFGLARREGTLQGDDDDRITATGQRVGTTRYLAPEQIRGAGSVRRSSDIYSLGAILFESLTGVAPFRADNTVDLQLQHLYERPPRPSELADVPRGLDHVLHTALAKDPDARFGTASELARAVAQALATQPVHRCEPALPAAATALLGLRGQIPLVGLRAAVRESGGLLAKVGATTIVVFPFAVSCAEGIRCAFRLARRLRPAAELSVVHVASLRHRARGQVYGAPLIRPESWIPASSTSSDEVLLTPAASCFVNAVRTSSVPDFFALRETSAPSTGLGASFITRVDVIASADITEVSPPQFGVQA